MTPEFHHATCVFGSFKRVEISEALPEVEAGDPILVLEAMKMENVIKSPASGVVSSVDVKTGGTVEKNEVMITFA